MYPLTTRDHINNNNTTQRVKQAQDFLISIDSGKTGYTSFTNFLKVIKIFGLNQDKVKQPEDGIV